MKHFKLFEQFIQELETPLNEATKWTNQEFEALNAFAKKLSKVDPKEFDPTSYKGVQSAVLNLKSVTDSISLVGAHVWESKNKDKCRPIKWTGTSWVEATPEEADKGSSVTEEYIAACEALFNEGIAAIKLVEKGEGQKLASMLPKLEADSDKLHKMNRKYQKAKGAGTWSAKKEYYGDSDQFKFQFETKVLKQYQNATSNKAAIDEIQQRIDSISDRANGKTDLFK